MQNARRNNFVPPFAFAFAAALLLVVAGRTSADEAVTNAAITVTNGIGVTVAEVLPRTDTNSIPTGETNTVPSIPAPFTGGTNVVVPAPSPPTTNAGASAPALTNAPATEPAPSFDSSRSSKSSRRETSPPPSSPSNARIDFSTFKILGERNIFDPNRSSRSGRSNPPSSEAPPPRTYAPSVVEAFSLVGTLAYAESQMAFIDGGSSQYKKALRLNDTVAGLKLKSVGASHATFDNDGAEIVLRVGQQLRREDRRAWQVNTQPTTYASTPLASATVSSTNSTNTTVTADGTATGTNAPTVTPAAAPAEPPPTPAMSEALRRLLENRKKEEEQ